MTYRELDHIIHRHPLIYEAHGLYKTMPTVIEGCKRGSAKELHANSCPCIQLCSIRWVRSISQQTIFKQINRKKKVFIYLQDYSSRTS